MSSYTSQHHAVIDLHERGFKEDFELLSNGVFWVQQKIFVSDSAFSVIEYHRIQSNDYTDGDIIILGVVSTCHCVKGILLHHFSKYRACLPGVLKNKINRVSSLPDVIN